MSRYPFVFSMMLSLFFLTISACGVKSPPSLSNQGFSLRIQDLQSEWREEELYLVGSFNGLKESEDKLDLIKGCRLYYAGYSMKAQPCSGCPIDYHGFHEFGREVISSEKFSLEVPKKIIGQISFFKVHLIGPKGAMGLPSNTIRVATEKDQ